MNSFWKSSLTFSLFTFISRVFGYLRDLTLAAFLGAGQIYDIFVVIFRIPNVFRSFFGEGAMAQSLVPSIIEACLLYTSPSPRDKRQSRMPSSA